MLISSTCWFSFGKNGKVGGDVNDSDKIEVMMNMGFTIYIRGGR